MWLQKECLIKSTRRKYQAWGKNQRAKKKIPLPPLPVERDAKQPTITSFFMKIPVRHWLKKCKRCQDTMSKKENKKWRLWLWSRMYGSCCQGNRLGPHQTIPSSIHYEDQEMNWPKLMQKRNHWKQNQKKNPLKSTEHKSKLSQERKLRERAWVNKTKDKEWRKGENEKVRRARKRAV